MTTEQREYLKQYVKLIKRATDDKAAELLEKFPKQWAELNKPEAYEIPRHSSL